MVSNTLCPVAHILGSQNVYSRAEGIAYHYWHRPVAMQGSDPNGDKVLGGWLYEIIHRLGGSGRTTDGVGGRLMG